MCPKVNPPQKVNLQRNDMLDRYLSGFYICCMKLVEVAKQCFVTPSAVEKALKLYDKEAYSKERKRRKEENARIRREKDRERKKTTKAREKDRERKRRKQKRSGPSHSGFDNSNS